MASNCGHENIEMNDCDGYCTRCGRVVGSYDYGDWRWFPGEDPSVYRVNLLVIQSLQAESRRKRAR